MYFFDLQSLKGDLVRGAIPARDQLVYALLPILGPAIPHTAAFSGFRPWTGLDWLTWAINWSPPRWAGLAMSTT